MLTEGGETPTSKKSRRHFLEVWAALLRSTSLSVVGPKLLCFYPCVNGRGCTKPTSKKSRRHFLEVWAAILRSTSLSDDLELEFGIGFGIGIRFLPKIEKSVKS